MCSSLLVVAPVVFEFSPLLDVLLELGSVLAGLLAPGSVNESMLVFSETGIIVSSTLSVDSVSLSILILIHHTYAQTSTQ